MNSVFLGQHRSTPGAYYRIKVKGMLTHSLAAPLNRLQIHHEAGITTLVGYMNDRAMLHGLLTQMRRLGLPLLWVQRIKSSDLIHFCPTMQANVADRYSTSAGDPLDNYSGIPEEYL